jgi:phosphoserine aminotransferase
MKMARVLNFYPGPSALPLQVLKEAREELLDWKETGMSVLEISHRSKEFVSLHGETRDLLRELMGIPDDYEILFLQGGASLQFAMIPMNLVPQGGTASYVVTGHFSRNAFIAAEALGKARLACTTEEEGKFFRIPRFGEIDMEERSAYCHLTSNNTIFGTQWKRFPETKGIPLVCDMTSDILSRRIDVSSFGLIYASAQKNLGPAGVAVVIVRKDLVSGAKDGLPDILSYKTEAAKDSMFNTPSCFAVYVMNKVLHWMRAVGGIDEIEKRNLEKARILYETIDKHADFFRTKVGKEHRSTMNVVFRLPTEELEAQFVALSRERGMVGVKGHRSVGGIRVSLYNAHDVESAEILSQMMETFVRNRG